MTGMRVLAIRAKILNGEAWAGEKSKQSPRNHDQV